MMVKKSVMRLLFASLAVFIMAACAPSPTALPPTAVQTRAPGAVALLATPKALPTPASMSEAVNFEDFIIRIGRVEINEQYKTKFGPLRDATPGVKFLWVQVIVENSGDANIELPGEEHFSVLDGAREFKPTYGHRDGFPDYTSLSGAIFPGSPLEGWLRFDIPAEAGLDDLQFAFLPESTRITYTRTQSGDSIFDHPLFLWRLETK
jgi:hypothetical protein